MSEVGSVNADPEETQGAVACDTRGAVAYETQGAVACDTQGAVAYDSACGGTTGDSRRNGGGDGGYPQEQRGTAVEARRHRGTHAGTATAVGIRRQRSGFEASARMLRESSTRGSLLGRLWKLGKLAHEKEPAFWLYRSDWERAEVGSFASNEQH